MYYLETEINKSDKVLLKLCNIRLFISLFIITILTEFELFMIAYLFS